MDLYRLGFDFLKQQKIDKDITQGCSNQGAEGEHAPPNFDRSVNYITTRGADYAQHIQGCNQRGNLGATAPRGLSMTMWTRIGGRWS